MLNETDLYHASISRNLGFDVGIKAGMLIFLFKPFSLQTRENKRETSVQSKIQTAPSEKCWQNFVVFRRVSQKKVYSTAKKLEYRNSLNKFIPASDRPNVWLSQTVWSNFYCSAQMTELFFCRTQIFSLIQCILQKAT